MCGFSATGRRPKNARVPAKCEDFGRAASYFSDINDLLAEGEGFEPSVRFGTNKSRYVRKLQIAIMVRRNSGSKTEAPSLRGVRFASQFAGECFAIAVENCGVSATLSQVRVRM